MLGFLVMGILAALDSASIPWGNTAQSTQTPPQNYAAPQVFTPILQNQQQLQQIVPQLQSLNLTPHGPLGGGQYVSLNAQQMQEINQANRATYQSVLGVQNPTPAPIYGSAGQGPIIVTSAKLGQTLTVANTALIPQITPSGFVPSPLVQNQQANLANRRLQGLV